MPIVIDGAAGLQEYAGKNLGQTGWTEMTFETIQAFADATGDHQWIHVDRERIATESPFGAPIAHGYLTLSLVAGAFLQLLELKNFKLVVNYGCNKVRFPNPLKEGMRWRLNLSLGEVSQKRDWWEGLFSAAIEIEGEAKPAVVAEVVYRFLP
jgi:acyl dehydratase